MRGPGYLVCATCAAVAAFAAAVADQEPQEHWTPHKHYKNSTIATSVYDATCRFTRFTCEPAVLKKKWRSCCSDPACPEECDTGTLRPDTRLLIMGNSHINEIHQALLCMNLPLLKTITFAPFSGIFGNAALMLGQLPPPPVTWTYEGDTGVLSDEHGDALPALRQKGAKQFNVAHIDRVVAYTFANGARLYSITNTPLQVTAGEDADPRETPFAMEDLANYLGFEWSELTGVLVNEGNYRSWAWRLFCHERAVAQALAEATAAAAAARAPPLSAAACAALLDDARKNRGVIDLESLVTRLGAAGFRGRALVARQLMVDAAGGGGRAPPLDVAAAARRAPFGVEFVDWAPLLEGRLCAAQDCGARGGAHMCLPGPPTDIARVVLRRLYAGGGGA